MVTLDMIDAGIKVASGMLISGVLFLIYLQRYQILGKRSTDELSRRRGLLEQVAEQVGQVHYAYQQYLGLATEFTRYGQRWPQSRRDEFARAGEELANVFLNLTQAESTLLLLGEKRLEKSLRIYGAKIIHLRRLIHAEKRHWSGEETQSLETIKNEISLLKERFFDALSVRYMPKKVYG